VLQLVGKKFTGPVKLFLGHAEPSQDLENSHVD
jgi:hypothetical protein